MNDIPEEKFYDYYMIHGGLTQIRMNIEMKINSRIQRRSSKIQHPNTVGEKDCINGNWRDLVNEINEKLKKDDLELVNYNVDK